MPISRFEYPFDSKIKDKRGIKVPNFIPIRSEQKKSITKVFCLVLMEIKFTFSS